MYINKNKGHVNVKQQHVRRTKIYAIYFVHWIINIIEFCPYTKHQIIIKSYRHKECDECVIIM